MKSKFTFFKFMSFALLLTLIVIVVVSCRKKDTEYNPVPPGPTPPPATPDVFSNKPLHLLSDYEISNHHTFPGHIINRLGNGLVGGDEDPLDPFTDIISALLDVHKGNSTAKEYATINAGLSQIQQQLDTLQNAVSSLAKQIGIEQSVITNMLFTINTNTYIGYIQGAMDSTLSTGLQYYPRQAYKYKAGLITLADFQSDTNTLCGFANNIQNNLNGYDVTGWALQLNKLLCPPGDPYGLLPLTDLIIQANPQDSASIMNGYMVLESQFLQIINSQFQCATMQANANVYCNHADTLAPTDWFTDEFTTYIKAEITGFLSAVDYLFINLDYRTQPRFVRDMQYAGAGLAADDIYVQGLARSQFIANLLYDALGLPYPVVCGHIITPVTYGTTGAAALEVTIGGVPKNTTPVQLSSQIPYTCWVQGNPAVCHPDNQWYVYRYGTLGQSDGSWTGSAQPLEVVGASWIHYVPIKGSITPLFYNPQNPNQTSATQTSECTFQFAYFSANWQWGLLQLTNSLLTDNWIKSNKPTKDQYFDFSSFNTNLVENSANVPFAATTNTWACTYQTTGLTWSNQYGTPGTYQLNGTTSTSSHFYVIVDGDYLNVTTGTELPPSGNIQAWAWYNANYTMKGSGGDDLTVSIGTVRNFTESEEGGPDFVTIGDDVVRNNFHDQAGTTYNSGFGKSANLKVNTAYQPGVQYYYQTANLTSVVPASITLISGYQFVYGGLYPLPSK